MEHDNVVNVYRGFRLANSTQELNEDCEHGTTVAVESNAFLSFSIVFRQ